MKISSAAALLGFGASVAAVAQKCERNDICFQFGIPDKTASSGEGDIYFQLSAPDSNQWVGLAQGDGMAGANMFVMYASADGKNVTVSGRQGVGHVMPKHNPSAKIELLEGSGISNGMMVANVKCSNCQKWDGGTMDFTTTGNTNWIYAHKVGDALNSDDLDERITQHDAFGFLQIPLGSAKSGSDVNPFVARGSSPSASGTSPSQSGSGTQQTGSPSPTGVTVLPGSSSSSQQDSKSGYTSLSQERQNSILMAHAAIACLAFVGLFPIGGIMMRIASFKNMVWVHAALQITAYVIYIVAVGMGIYMAQGLKYFNNTHPILGLVIFAVLFFQPFIGFVHHRQYSKVNGRTIWSYLHVNVGRIAILLGMVNGGLGLRLADAEMPAKIAYGVVAGIVGLVYIGCAVFGETKKKRDARQRDKSQISMVRGGDVEMERLSES